MGFSNSRRQGILDSETIPQLPALRRELTVAHLKSAAVINQSCVQADLIDFKKIRYIGKAGMILMLETV
jgi:hypothetical protein